MDCSTWVCCRRMACGFRRGGRFMWRSWFQREARFIRIFVNPPFCMHCETISVSAALSFPICALLPWPFTCSSLGLNLLLTVSDSFKLNFGTSRDDLIDCTGFRISTAASDSILADAILVLCLMVTLPSSAKGMLSCEDVETCWFLRGLMFSPAGFSPPRFLPYVEDSLVVLLRFSIFFGEMAGDMALKTGLLHVLFGLPVLFSSLAAMLLTLPALSISTPLVVTPLGAELSRFGGGGGGPFLLARMVKEWLRPTWRSLEL